MFLGTPHHGAPLERGGHGVDRLFGASPYTVAFSRLGQLRSAGITDLRHGALLDEDWQGHDRFAHGGDRRHALPLPRGVRAFAIAGSASKGPPAGDRAARGDGLVPVASALGTHVEPKRKPPHSRNTKVDRLRYGASRVAGQSCGVCAHAGMARGKAWMMAPVKPTAVTIAMDDGEQVSGLLQLPADAHACFVFAHGAGAGMNHAFMTAFADDLCARGVATLRYQFPYMERGSKRPDKPAVAHAAVRAAVAEAARLAPGLPLFAGGKSFGGRMTSQAQAAAPLAGVLGLVFVGFPLHPAGKPADDRAAHLVDVRVPMLFLQGTRDPLAELALLQPVCERLGPRATLEVVDGADHSFHVPARTGRTDVDVRKHLADVVARWLSSVSAR